MKEQETLQLESLNYFKLGNIDKKLLLNSDPFEITSIFVFEVVGIASEIQDSMSKEYEGTISHFSSKVKVKKIKNTNENLLLECYVKCPDENKIIKARDLKIPVKAIYRQDKINCKMPVLKLEDVLDSRGVYPCLQFQIIVKQLIPLFNDSTPIRGRDFLVLVVNEILSKNGIEEKYNLENITTYYSQYKLANKTFSQYDILLGENAHEKAIEDYWGNKKNLKPEINIIYLNKDNTIDKNPDNIPPILYRFFDKKVYRDQFFEEGKLKLSRWDDLRRVDLNKANEERIAKGYDEFDGIYIKRIHIPNDTYVEFQVERNDPAYILCTTTENNEVLRNKFGQYGIKINNPAKFIETLFRINYGRKINQDRDVYFYCGHCIYIGEDNVFQEKYDIEQLKSLEFEINNLILNKDEPDLRNIYLSYGS